MQGIRQLLKNMYKLELITEDHDLLLKEFYFQKWDDIYKKILDIRKFNLSNIKIDIFKESDADLVYLGNFYNVRTDAAIEKTGPPPKIQVNHKYIKIISSIIILLLLFPIIILLEITRSKDI